MSRELYVFFGMAICGAALSLLFDLCRGVRKALTPPDFAVIITDIAFWIICSAAVACAVWYFNSGIVRAYEFLGLILGALIYFLTLSRYIVSGICLISEYILKIFKIILRFLLTPFVFLYKIISSIHIKRKSEDEIR